MHGYYRGAIMIPHTPKYPGHGTGFYDPQIDYSAPKYPGHGTGFYDPQIDYSAGNWPMFITSAAQCVANDPEGCLRYVGVLADIADSIIARNAMGL